MTVFTGLFDIASVYTLQFTITHTHTHTHTHTYVTPVTSHCHNLLVAFNDRRSSEFVFFLGLSHKLFTSTSRNE
jgi:hypothetical protein